MTSELVITILDLPEVLEVLHEALACVPEWERAPLRERLTAILDRARAEQAMRETARKMLR